MMKKVSVSVSALLFALLLFAAAVLPVFAEITKEYAVTDDAGVFDAAQTQALTAQMQNASRQTGWQFIVHTSNDGIYSDEDLERHYNNYYDSQYGSNGFQYDAIMLVIDRGSGKRDILVYGEVRDYFKDKSRYDIIKNAMRPYLDNDDMYGATEQFIAKATEVYGMGKTPALVLSLQKYGIFIGLAAVAAGLVFFFVNRSRYKNMGKSGTYDLGANSDVQLTEAQDDFVTQHTTVRTIQRDDNHSSGSSHSGGGNSSGGF